VSEICQFTLVAVIVDAYENARDLSLQYYNAAPECRFHVRSRKSLDIIIVPLSTVVNFAQQNICNIKI